MTPLVLVGWYHRFGGAYCPFIKVVFCVTTPGCSVGGYQHEPYTCTLNMEAECSSEALATIY